jgi:hypothetical protein
MDGCYAGSARHNRQQSSTPTASGQGDQHVPVNAGSARRGAVPHSAEALQHPAAPLPPKRARVLQCHLRSASCLCPVLAHLLLTHSASPKPGDPCSTNSSLLFALRPYIPHRTPEATLLASNAAPPLLVEACCPRPPICNVQSLAFGAFPTSSCGTPPP